MEDERKIKELNSDERDKLITPWLKWAYERNKKKITAGTREWFVEIWGRFTVKEFQRMESYDCIKLKEGK